MATYSVKIGQTEVEVEGTWERGCKGDYWTPSTPDSFEPERFYRGDQDITEIVKRLDRITKEELINDIANRINEDYG